MKLVIYAGAVWSHCSPVEVERLDVSSREEALEALVEFLCWLPREQAERVAREVIDSEEAILAGYSNDVVGLRAEPPEDAEPCDRSWLGDTVYVVSGKEEDEYWVPFYVHASIEEEEED
jgi:hypothetical protein